MIFHFIRRFIVDAYYEIKEGIFFIMISIQGNSISCFLSFL